MPRERQSPATVVDNGRHCPCGCLTTPFFDDPDCVRHEPIERRGESYKIGRRLGRRPSAADLRAINAEVPRPKPSRGNSQDGGLMVVHAWVDPNRALTLLRGNKCVRLLLEEARVIDVARWSTTGRGWVLADGPAADALALAESWRGCIVKVHRVGDAA